MNGKDIFFEYYIWDHPVPMASGPRRPLLPHDFNLCFEPKLRRGLSYL